MVWSLKCGSLLQSFLSYSRRQDHNNLGILRSLQKWLFLEMGHIGHGSEVVGDTAMNVNWRPVGHTEVTKG